MVRLLSYTTTTWIKNINVSDNFDHFRLSIWKLKLKAKLYFTDVTCSSISYSNCFPHVVFTFSGVQSSSEPRGSQSGRKKRRDESFQVRAKEPLATDSHRTISKNSSGCRLLIRHKKMLCIIVPNLRRVSPEFFSWVRTRRLLSGSFTKLVRARETFIFYFPNQKRRNYRWVEKTFGMLSAGAIQFAPRIFCFWLITMYRK